MSLFGSNRVIGLDVGSSQIKLAEFSIKDMELTVNHIGVRSVALAPGSSDDQHPLIVDAIRDIMSEFKIKPAPLVLSVSGQSAFLRSIKLPPVRREKIYQTVLYEAQQNVPFPINEVVWDYQLMGSPEGDEEMNVVLVAMKSDIVETITDCVDEVGLDLQIVDVAPMALFNAVRYNYEELDACTLVVDVGARSTNLIFLEGRRFFSRTLPMIGGNAITQQIMREFDLDFEAAEELKLTHASVAFGGAYEDYSDKVLSRVSKTVRSSMTRLHVEMERTINFYRTQQGGTAPQRVLLAGGSSVIQRMDEFFREKLKVDVDYLNPFRNIVVGNSIADEDIVNTSPVVGEAVGAALRHVLPCPLEINLVPPKILSAKEFDRKKPFFIFAGVGLVLIALCWLGYFARISTLIQSRTNRMNVLVSGLSKVDKQLSSVEEDQEILVGDMEKLTKLIGKRTQWVEVVDAIHSRMPDGMWLLSFVPVVGTVEEEPEIDPRTGKPVRSSRSRSRATEEQRAYTKVEIRGMIFADKANDYSIRDFRDRLKECPVFKEDGTRIVLAPIPTLDDYTREFTIEMALKEPLALSE